MRPKMKSSRATRKQVRDDGTSASDTVRKDLKATRFSRFRGRLSELEGDRAERLVEELRGE